MLKPTKVNIIVSLANSLIVMSIGLMIPSIGFRSVFLSRELSGQIISLMASLAFSFVVYYPLACGLIYIFNIFTRKELVKVQNLILAVLLIIIFNPITFSIVITKIINKPPVNSPTVINTVTQEKLCGLQIIEVNAPSAKDAGLKVGEVITNVNDIPVDTMESLTHALANKRPNDIVTVITNGSTYNVPLFANPQNPQQILMGIKVNPTECDK